MINNRDYKWSSIEEIPIFCGSEEKILMGLSKQVFKLIENLVPIGYRTIFKEVHMRKFYSETELQLFFRDIEMMCGYQAIPFGVLYIHLNLLDVDEYINDKKMEGLIKFIDKNRKNMVFVIEGLYGSGRHFKRLNECFERVCCDWSSDEFEKRIGYKM